MLPLCPPAHSIAEGFAYLAGISTLTNPTEFVLLMIQNSIQIVDQVFHKIFDLSGMPDPLPPMQSIEKTCEKLN